MNGKELFESMSNIDDHFIEEAENETIDKTMWLCLSMDVESDWPEGSDDERLALQIISNIASGKGKQQDYHVPVQIWFHDGRNALIAEETVIISGEPAELGNPRSGVFSHCGVRSY